VSTRWWAQHGFTVALVLLAATVALDVLLGPGIVVSGSYAMAAVLAALTTTVRRTAVVAGAAVALSALSGTWNDNVGAVEWEVRVALCLGLSGLAVLMARMRAQREKALRHMTTIAEVAQRALLRAMPNEIGSVGLAARYVSATRDALVGGDLYEVAATPYGVRTIVGDVRGKGLEAVQLAGIVLSTFRRTVFMHERLEELATELDAAVRNAADDDEDFVTAVLAEFHDDHSVTLVNCGHHPPLLVDHGHTEALASGEPLPPLGLRPRPRSVRRSWPQGARILIYTDGLVEARNESGTFFPLAEHASALTEGDLEDALDRLLQRLDDYVGRRILDDLAVVLVEQGGPTPGLGHA
jgi:sigma-B regulation protein RsbU (phosphoserine phosphatase)